MLLIVSLCIMFLSGTALSSSSFCHGLSPVREIVKPHSKIIVLSTDRGSLWLLKQRIGHSIHAQAMTIVEALGAYVAQSIGVPSNKVSIISAQDSCAHKFFKDMPATLHTFVPGAALESSTRYKNLSISQKCRKKGAGPCGLTLSLIKTMALHNQLPAIMAVDTFTSTKRNSGGLMYDEKTDTFYMVDFGSSYRETFAEKSLAFVASLHQSRSSLTRAERAALRQYVDTLRHLLSIHTPESLCAQLDYFAYQAGLTDQAFGHDRKYASFSDYLQQHRKRIYANYRASEKLVSFLTTF